MGAYVTHDKFYLVTSSSLLTDWEQMTWVTQGYVCFVEGYVCVCVTKGYVY